MFTFVHIGEITNTLAPSCDTTATYNAFIPETYEKGRKTNQASPKRDELQFAKHNFYVLMQRFNGSILGLRQCLLMSTK